MNYDPTDPNYWLQWQPDDAMAALISEFATFVTHIRAVYYPLLMDTATEDIRMQDDMLLREFIQEKNDELEAIGQILEAATRWKDAYREGKIIPKNASSNNDD